MRGTTAAWKLAKIVDSFIGSEIISLSFYAKKKKLRKKNYKKVKRKKLKIQIVPNILKISMNLYFFSKFLIVIFPQKRKWKIIF